MMASVTGWAGQRTPTVSSPAVVASGTTGLRLRIMVSGPGQKFRASVYASGGTSSQNRGSHWAEGTWMMSGLSCGRPFASKMRRTASGSSALAPRPYTVSVGIASRPPRQMMSAAICTFSSTTRCWPLMFVRSMNFVSMRFYLLSYAGRSRVYFSCPRSRSAVSAAVSASISSSRSPSITSSSL